MYSTLTGLEGVITLQTAVIPDVARLPQSSESTLGSSSVLSEHTPAYHLSTPPKSDNVKMQQTKHKTDGWWCQAQHHRIQVRV